MFNLDNFELDFDEDFTNNVFTKHHQNEKESKPCKNSSNNKALKEINTESVNIKPSENLKRQVETPANEKAFSKKLKSDTLIDLLNERISPKPQKEHPEPAKKRFSHDGLLQRKFPGPAGLLPDKPFREIQDLSFAMDKACQEDDDKEKVEQIIYSQSSGSVFLDSAYQQLVCDFDLNESSNPLYKYTVEWVKKSATNKSLTGRKIPFLAVTLHCINNSTPDPVLVLRDPTGEINGTLHREVWSDMGAKLRTGIALALRQVGVLITGVIRRQIYLNITINNILAIYSPSESGTGVEITAVNKASKADLLRSIEGWQAQAPPKPPRQVSTGSLFSTVADSGSRGRRLNPQTNNEEIKNLRNKLQDFVEGSNGRDAKKGKHSSENLGTVFAEADFSEDMKVPGNKDERTGFEGRSGIGDRRKGSKGKEKPFRMEESSQVLSQAESLIFEEVLSGINLDEFEM